MEKMIIMFNWMQLHGLLWVLATNYPWPDGWLYAVIFAPLSNFDVPEMIKFFTKDTYVPGGVIHALIFLIVPCLLVATFAIVRHQFRKKAPEGAVDDDIFIGKYTQVETAFLLAAEFLYIPCALAAFRCFACGRHPTSGVDVLLLDFATECFSGLHIGLIIIAVILGGFYLVAVPCFYLYLTSKIVVFREPHSHDIFLQNRELEYLMGMNNIHETRRIHWISAFRRPFAYYRPWYCFHRLAMVAVLILVGPFVSPSAERVHPVILMCVINIPFLYNFAYKMFRVESSNRMIFCQILSVGFTNLVAIVSAGTPLSKFLESGTLVPVLLGVNGLCVAFFLGFWIHSRLVAREPWPITEREVLDLCVTHAPLLSALNQSKVLLETGAFCPSEFFPRYKVKELAKVLREHYKDFDRKLARMRLGLYNYPRGVHFERGHLNMDAQKVREKLDKRFDLGILLSDTVQDTIEDLAHLFTTMHNSLSAFSDASSEDQAAKLRHMQGIIRGLGRSFKRKNFDRMLMKPEKHMLLRKLLVVRNLLGDEFVYSQRKDREFHPPSSQATFSASGAASGAGGGASGAAASGGAAGGAGGFGGGGGGTGSSGHPAVMPGGSTVTFAGDGMAFFFFFFFFFVAYSLCVWIAEGRASTWKRSFVSLAGRHIVFLPFSLSLSLTSLSFSLSFFLRRLAT